MAAVAKTLLAFAVTSVFTYEFVSTYSPIFIGEVKSLTVNEGERASFTCQVENLKEYQKIGWYRSHPRKLLSLGLTRKSDDPRLSVVHDDNMKWTLQITNVTRYDQGTYQCVVHFNRTSISQVAHLDVRGPRYERVNHFTASFGGTASITCEEKNIPQHTEVEWLRLHKEKADTKMWELRDQRIPFSRSKGIWTLKITNVTKDDQGQYKYVFKTHPPVSQTGSLKLIGPIFVGEVKNLTVNEGERASFTCQVENLKEYRKIEWYRLDPRRILNPGSTVKFYDPRLSVVHDDNMKWTLQITNVTRYDQGRYQCTVNFNGTSISQVAHLYVRGPRYERVNNFTASFGGTASITCEEKNIPQHTEVKWLRLHKEKADTKMWELPDQRISFSRSKGIWTLKITNVTKDDQGQYKCVFKTHPPVSQTGLLKLIGPIFVGEVKSLTVNEGERASFTCQVENLTKYRQIEWYRLHPRRILSVGLTRKSYDPRLSVVHDDNMKWTLQITSVTRYDQGTYQCVVNFNGTLPSQVAHLYVRVKDQCNIRTYFVSWQNIKAQLGNSEIEEADVKSILLQSKTNVKGIYIKWCPSLRTSCPNGRTQCVPSVEQRNVSVGINVGNTQKLLHFNYLEATECSCNLEQNYTVKFPVIFKPKIIDELFRPDFFNSTTIELTWEEVKQKVRKPRQVSSPEDFDILRKSRLIDDYKIPVKVCLSDSCVEPSVSVIPADQLIKHISLPIKVINDTKIAILEYVEVTKCYCSAAKLNVRLMETILNVKIGELCLQSDDVNESGMTLTSYTGCDIMMPFYFPHQSGDVTRITVIRATDSGKPLSIRSPLRTDLVTYDASQSWVRSVEFEICEGVVELRLKNVTYAFNDTYYCSVESKNSSACFSQVNLIVAEKIPEKGCPVIWRPEKTSLDWNTFLQRLDNATILTRLIPKETELNETFPLQICPAEPISCPGPLKPQHCVASRSRTRLKTVCVPRENDEMKIEIEYEEDDTCECRLSNVSLPNRKAILDHQETKPIAIVRAEHVGNCPSACRPQKYKVKWQYIREVISNETSYSIPNFVPGENIRVKRCPQGLTTCEATGKKCGASVYEMKEKKMEITEYNLLFVVKYLEVKKCKCLPASEIDSRDSKLFILEDFDSQSWR